jgi:hypothetical protein
LSPLKNERKQHYIHVRTYQNYILLRMFLSSSSSWVGRILNLLQVKYIRFSFCFFKKQSHPY